MLCRVLNYGDRGYIAGYGDA